MDSVLIWTWVAVVAAVTVTSIIIQLIDVDERKRRKIAVWLLVTAAPTILVLGFVVFFVRSP